MISTDNTPEQRANQPFSTRRDARPSVAAQSSAKCPPEFEQIELSGIPERHPVRRFSDCYLPLLEGHLLPNVEEITSIPGIQRLADWVQILEPVRRGRHLEFRVYDLAEGNAQWLDERFEGDFALPRFQEAIVAGVLRESLFSLGTVPHPDRFFIRQYRGVFPLFANNRPRLCLAVVAAETFIEIADS